MMQDHHPDPDPNFSSIDTSRPKIIGLNLVSAVSSFCLLSQSCIRSFRAIVFFMLIQLCDYSFKLYSAAGPLSLTEAEMICLKFIVSS